MKRILNGLNAFCQRINMQQVTAFAKDNCGLIENAVIQANVIVFGALGKPNKIPWRRLELIGFRALGLSVGSGRSQ